MMGQSFFPFDPEPNPDSQGDRHQRLQKYRQAYTNAVRTRIPIPADLQTGLTQLQQQLQLSEDDVKPIQREVVQTVRAEIQERLQNLDEYQQAFEQSVEESFPISAEERERLDSLCYSLDLTPEAVRPIEEMVEHQWQAKHRAAKKAADESSEPEDRETPNESNTSDASSSLNGSSQGIENAPDSTDTPASSDLSQRLGTAPSAAPLLGTTLESSDAVDMAQSDIAQTLNVQALEPALLLPAADALPPETLLSERHIDYKLLEQQLKNKQWLEADEETCRILVELGKSDAHTADWLDHRAIAHLPATDLHTIDRLWVEHSQGKYGFSIQANIYFNSDPNRPVVSGNPINFGKQVEWVQLDRSLLGFKFYRQLHFQILRAPAGHLPAKWFWDIPWWESLRLGGVGTGRGGCGNDDGILFTFMSKLVTCGVTSRQHQSP